MRSVSIKFVLINIKNTFNKFIITGGSSCLPDIENFIASTLNVTVEILDPFKTINNDIKVDNLNQYSTALGLALRGLEI